MECNPSAPWSTQQREKARESYPSPMVYEDEFSENPNHYRVLAMIKKIQILSTDKQSHQDEAVV